MDLYIIRHAVAQERQTGLDDRMRQLTTEGRRRFKRVVKGLDRLGIRFDRIYHSPWVRAVQTAKLLAPLGSKLIATPHLAASPTQGLLDVLNSEPAADTVAVVGHEPWMSDLLVWLVGGPRGGNINFKKGGVAWLRGDAQAGGMSLRAMVPPRYFRQLAP